MTRTPARAQPSQAAARSAKNWPSSMAMTRVATASPVRASAVAVAQSGAPVRARNGRVSWTHRTSVTGSALARMRSTRHDVLPDPTGPVIR